MATAAPAPTAPPPPPNEQEQSALDPAQVSQFISDRYEEWSKGRYIFEKDWFRNICYAAGLQWIIYDKSSRAWQKRSLPGWFPRPVTNKFAEIGNDIIAAMKRPTISFTPTNDQAASVALAEVGSEIQRVLFKEASIADIELMLRAWLVYTGNAFLYTTYHEDDSGAYGFQTLPGMVCATCGYQTADQVEPMCPQCGAPLAPGEVQVPKGKLISEIIPPFELFCDASITNFKDAEGFMRVRAFPIKQAQEIAEKLFGEGAGEKVSESESKGGTTANTQLYSQALSALSSTFGATSLGSSNPSQGTTLLYEMFHKPTSEYPDGLYAIRIGDNPELCKPSPLPSKRKSGQHFLPLVHFGGDYIPGRLWRKTRLDDVVHKQNQRNMVESMIMLIVQRMGSPGWLIPRGCSPDRIAGVAGIKINYTALSVGGQSFAKPERFTGDEVPQTVLLWLNKIDDDMQRVAGTFFLQGGDTPPGVTAASALAYLGEKAQRAMSPWLQAYEDGWVQWIEQAIEIFRTRASEPRIYMAGGNNRWETRRFIGTDLEGEIEAQVEAGSAFPQSQAAIRANIEQLIKLQLINPQDPLTAYNILQQCGLAHMAGAVDDDFKIAASEFDLWVREQKPPEVEPVFDNHMAHWVQHQRDAKTDKYRDLPPEVRAQWTSHALQHMELLMQQNALGMGPNPGQQPTHPGAAPAPSGPNAGPGEGGGGAPTKTRPIKSPATGETLQPGKPI